MNQLKLALKLTLFTFALGVGVMPHAKDVNSEAVSSFPDLNNTLASAVFDDEKIVALENRMQQFVADGDVFGIATLLVHDGNVVSHSQAGVRDIVAGEPITHDTIYRIYSMTKPITTTAAMILYEEGKLRLDDPVEKYLPAFKNQKVLIDGALVDVTHAITIRELMSHTAGVTYGIFGNSPIDQQYRAAMFGED